MKNVSPMVAAALALTLAALPGRATAQTAASPVQVALVSLVVGKDAKGNEVLFALPKSGTRPGEVLAWQATAQSTSDKDLRGLTLNIPIPEATVYVAESAKMTVNGQAVTPKFSTDGKTFAFAPLKKTVQVTKNGVTSSEEVTVSPSEYRAVRFMVPVLAAKTSVLAEVRTSVK
ncbi:hypothetical protein [Deinococcus sp.]|uniref:hypothetical protein n=1 Tax=Deinococcus sp. TaxID=47478 RepID=UPI003CC533D9